MAIDTKNQVIGLVAQFNPLATSPGALAIAENASMSRENIAQNRRGYKVESEDLPNQPVQSMEYLGTPLVHDGTDLYYRSAPNTYSAFPTPIAAPSGRKMRYMESQGNLYVTSDAGVQVVDSLGNFLRNAGMYQSLDLSFTLSAVGTGFLANGSQVAYRAVSQREDFNQNILVGAPSSRLLVINNAGAARNVSLTLQLNPLAEAGDVVRIFRSTSVVGVSTDLAGDNLFLAFEYELVSADITAGTVTFIDSLPDSLLSTPLYTNETQEGALQANNEPPFCKDMTLYKSQFAIYANTVSKQTLFSTLVSVNDIRTVLSTTTNSATNTFTAASVADLGNAAIGWRVYGANIAAGTTITNIVGTTVTMSLNASASGATTVNLVTNQTITLNSITYSFGNADILSGAGSPRIAVGLSGLTALDIADTARGIVRVVNAYAPNTTLLGFYLSGPSDLPGKMSFQEVDFGGSPFSLNCSSASTIGSDFFPALATAPTTTSSTTSVADTARNRFYYSKAGLGEAVPLLNYFDVGPKNFEILRVIALRDSMIIIKEEGAYRLTGDSPTSFNVGPIDLTVRSKAPDSFVALANQVYGLTDQGVCAINETGVSVVSHQIEQDLIPIIPLATTGTNAYGISYESDRTYLLSVPQSSGDASNVQTYAYNVFTRAWSKWTFGITCGDVLTTDDKLYFGKPNDLTYFIERKDLSSSDFADPEIPITINSISGITLEIDSPEVPMVGDGVKQLSSTLRILTVAQVSATVYTVTLSSTPPISWGPGVAELVPSIKFNIRWFPWSGGSSGALKLIQDLKILTDPLQNNNTVTGITQTISTDAVSMTTDIDIEAGATRWGFAPWGTSPWGGSSESYSYTTWPPQQQAYLRLLNLGVKHNRVFERISVAGYSIKFEPISEKTDR